MEEREQRREATGRAGRVGEVEPVLDECREGSEANSVTKDCGTSSYRRTYYGETKTENAHLDVQKASSEHTPATRRRARSPPSLSDNSDDPSPGTAQCVTES